MPAKELSSFLPVFFSPSCFFALGLCFWPCTVLFCIFLVWSFRVVCSAHSHSGVKSVSYSSMCQTTQNEKAGNLSLFFDSRLAKQDRRQNHQPMSEKGVLHMFYFAWFSGQKLVVFSVFFLLRQVLLCSHAHRRKMSACSLFRCKFLCTVQTKYTRRHFTFKTLVFFISAGHVRAKCSPHVSFYYDMWTQHVHWISCSRHRLDRSGILRLNFPVVTCPTDGQEGEPDFFARLQDKRFIERADDIIHTFSSRLFRISVRIRFDPSWSAEGICLPVW